MLPNFRIDTRSEGDRVDVFLTGEFDLAALKSFEDALAQLDQDNPQTIVVDLEGLDFMDSSGLRALVIADERARAAGRRFAIVRGSMQVRRLFAITQVEQRLDLIDSVSEL